MRIELLRYPGDEVGELAILIVITGDGTHTGLLYRFGNRLYLLDQCWHECFRVDSFDVNTFKRRYGCVMPDLLPEEINDVVATCELIVDRSIRKGPQRLPYGFGLPEGGEVNRDGELIWGGGVGLTCSTFVLAVFEAARVPFIDLSGWVRRPADDDRQEELLNMMARGIPEHGIPPADPAHIAKARGELPCIRVRPEEVAAAGLSPKRPAEFGLVERTARWILERITIGAERGSI